MITSWGTLKLGVPLFYYFATSFSLSLLVFRCDDVYAFHFNEDDPPLLPDVSADPNASAYLLSSGEFDFDAYVDVSPSAGRTGGDDDDAVMHATVDMLNKIDTGSVDKDFFTKLIRIPGVRVYRINYEIIIYVSLNSTGTVRADV